MRFTLFDCVAVHTYYVHMKNVTLSLDEQLLAQARSYAHKHGTTLNAMIRELLAKTVQRDADQSGATLIQLFDQLAGHSAGWQWKRDDIYDDTTSQR